MKTLVVLSLLALSTYCFVKEDVQHLNQNSRTLENPMEIKVTQREANAVIKRNRRAYDYYERYYPRVKTQLELKKEQCENYLPCDRLSEWIGFYQAYPRFFGPV
ncbi:osteocalcin-like isoform 1-T1 [Rhinophrynus dorsalis]